MIGLTLQLYNFCVFNLLFLWFSYDSLFKNIGVSNIRSGEVRQNTLGSSSLNSTVFPLCMRRHSSIDIFSSSTPLQQQKNVTHQNATLSWDFNFGCALLFSLSITETSQLHGNDATRPYYHRPMRRCKGDHARHTTNCQIATVVV